jgi:hypothetical protein
MRRANLHFTTPSAPSLTGRTSFPPPMTPAGHRIRPLRALNRMTYSYGHEHPVACESCSLASSCITCVREGEPLIIVVGKPASNSPWPSPC